jgi:hypothetical protein
MCSRCPWVFLFPTAKAFNPNTFPRSNPFCDGIALVHPFLVFSVESGGVADIGGLELRMQGWV